MAQQGGSGGAGAATDEYQDVSASPPTRVLTAHGCNPETPARKFAKVGTGEMPDASGEEATEPAPMGASSAQATEGNDAAESTADPPLAAVPPGAEEEGEVEEKEPEPAGMAVSHWSLGGRCLAEYESWT